MLRSNNKPVTRTIVIRKVVELFPMFKGGFIAQVSYLQLRNGFTWGSRQGTNYVMYVYLELQERCQ